MNFGRDNPSNHNLEAKFENVVLKWTHWVQTAINPGALGQAHSVPKTIAALLVQVGILSRMPQSIALPEIPLKSGSRTPAQEKQTRARVLGAHGFPSRLKKLLQVGLWRNPAQKKLTKRAEHWASGKGTTILVGKGIKKHLLSI